MRRALFHLVAHTIGIQVIIITWLADKARFVLGIVGHFLMNTIDPTLLKTYTSMMEQSEDVDELAKQNLELRLLALR